MSFELFLWHTNSENETHNAIFDENVFSAERKQIKSFLFFPGKRNCRFCSTSCVCFLDGRFFSPFITEAAKPNKLVINIKSLVEEKNLDDFPGFPSRDNHKKAIFETAKMSVKAAGKKSITSYINLE